MTWDNFKETSLKVVGWTSFAAAVIIFGAIMATATLTGLIIFMPAVLLALTLRLGAWIQKVRALREVKHDDLDAELRKMTEADHG